jgi:hypothetical protein
VGEVSPGRDVEVCVMLVACIVGAVAILSSTMSKNPVLNPFAAILGGIALLFTLLHRAR